MEMKRYIVCLVAISTILACAKEPTPPPQKLKAFEGHNGGVELALYSPDGKYILTVGGDSTAKLWERTTGVHVRSFLGHTQRLTSAAFSPDGKYLVTGSKDGTARIWNVATATLFHSLNYIVEVLSVAFSPTAQQILVGSSDGNVTLWDLQERKGIRIFNHRSAVSSVAFAKSGKRILTGGADNKAKLWSIDNATIPIQEFTAHTNTVTSVRFSVSDAQVLTGSLDGKAILWTIGNAIPSKIFFGIHRNGVHTAELSPDESIIVTTGVDDVSAQVWDAKTTAPMFPLPHREIATSAIFSADGKEILTSSLAEGYTLFHVADQRELQSFTGHTLFVSSIKIEPNKRQLLTGSWDGTVKIRDIETGALIKEITQANLVTQADFLPDSQYIVVGDLGGLVKLWDLNTGALTRTFAGHIDWITALAISPDGKQMLTGGNDNTAKLWNLMDGKEVATVTDHTAPVNIVALEPGGQFFLTASSSAFDCRTRLWDRTGTLLHVFDSGREGNCPIGASFSEDGKKIFLHRKKDGVTVWDTATRQKLDNFPRITYLSSLSIFSDIKFYEDSNDPFVFFPDQSYLLSANGSQRHLKIVDIQSGISVYTFEEETQDIIQRATLSKDKRLVAFSERSKIYIWSLPEKLPKPSLTGGGFSFLR